MENNIDYLIKNLQKNPKLVTELNYEQLQAAMDYLQRQKKQRRAK